VARVEPAGARVGRTARAQLARHDVPGVHACFVLKTVTYKYRLRYNAKWDEHGHFKDKMEPNISFEL
jgi:hypothetical protein